MTTQGAAEYMTKEIMPSNRERGCKCEYDQQKYQDGDWSHDKGCPSPYIECLPNVRLLTEAMRQVGYR